jgi:hypothetical protein
MGSLFSRPTHQKRRRLTTFINVMPKRVNVTPKPKRKRRRHEKNKTQRRR